MQKYYFFFKYASKTQKKSILIENPPSTAYGEFDYHSVPSVLHFVEEQVAHTKNPESK